MLKRLRLLVIKDENKKEILSSFLENIGCLADPKYQERVWIRREGPECDDIDDAVCDFFDEDYILEKYKDFGITNIQIKLLLNLYEKLRTFTDSFHIYSGKRSTEQLTNLPEWAEIREIAKNVLKAFHIS